MSEKFEDYAFYYLKVFGILLFISSFCIITGTLIVLKSSFIYPNHYHKKIGYSFISIFFLAAIIAYILFFFLVYPIPEDLDISSEKDYEYDTGGLNSKIKIDKEKNQILKKSMSMFYKTDEKCELQNCHSKVVSVFSKRENDKLPKVNYFVFSLNKYYNWRSVKIRAKLCKECEYIVNTYDLNEKDCSWKEDYIDYSLQEFKNLDKDKLKRQLIKLDHFLKEKSLYLNDVRPDNIRMTKNGDLRIIDGEFFTDSEMKYYKYVPYVFVKLPLMNRLVHIDKKLVEYYM